MEGELDELLPQALMSVQRQVHLRFGALAAKLNCEDERAYNLLYTLAGWGSIRLVKESDELAHTTFQTPRDMSFSCGMIVVTTFEFEGSTAAGGRVPQMSMMISCSRKAHTYVGVNVPQALAHDLGRTSVNIALKRFVLVVGSLMFIWHSCCRIRLSWARESGSLAAISGLTAKDVFANKVEVYLEPYCCYQRMQCQWRQGYPTRP